MLVKPGPLPEDARPREAVSIHTRKIFDSCRDKDCMEDLRLYPTSKSAEVLRSALSIRPRSASLGYVSINVDEIAFNRGFYTVDISFYYDVTLDAMIMCGSYETVRGMCTCDKRLILYGGEGSTKVYESGDDDCGIVLNKSAHKPKGVLEAVDPIILDAKLVDIGAAPGGEQPVTEVPEFVSAAFNGDIVFDSKYGKNCYVTLGQFSIVRLERETQLVVPAYEYALPDKECARPPEDDPCAIFDRIGFPVSEFFPHSGLVSDEQYRTETDSTYDDEN